jgi:dipeptidyl-peptidase 4
MRITAPHVAFALLATAIAAAPAASQQKLLTLEDLSDPDKRVDFSGSPPSGFEWLGETHFLMRQTDPKTRATSWLRVEAATGKAAPFIDAAKMEAALARLPGVGAAEAKRLAAGRPSVVNERRTAAVLTIAGDLYLYTFASESATRLTFDPGQEEVPSFSPDGAFVAFVRGGDLYAVDVATQRERRLTTGGSAEILNGKLDWVYQEEIYGRGQYRGYWWSPDSSRIAYLQLDERKVPTYTLVDDLEAHPKVETWPYPKAGDPNPVVLVGVVRLAGGAPTWVDLSRYASSDILVVSVEWTPGGDKVVCGVQDREQTWLDLVSVDPASGQGRVLFRETTRAWVDAHDTPPARWLKDGSFLWLSERTGYKHLFHYRADGTLLRQLSDGPWEVRALHGVDEGSGLVYFAATERSAIGSDVYRIRLDGSGLTRLSSAPGTHGAVFSPGFTLYVDSWSTAVTPTQVRVHRADGSELRLIHEGKVPALAEYRLSKPEFLQVKTRDGFAMEAMILKPPDFDPSRKYPVFQETYAGPQSPTVRDAWGRSRGFSQLLAQRGIVVWACDNRSASGKGAVSAWSAYKRLGEQELQDIEDGLAHLKAQGWADASRIGISGWSYGGFMVSYALTHSKSFAMGIAGGSVTDWRNYDSVYTERYMLMPQHNAEGYDRSSPRLAAKDLHGRLLLVHGTLDDNVHPGNTLQMAHELQQAGKPFRLALYPRSGHGVTAPRLAKDLLALTLEFIEETLLGRAPVGAR